MMKIGVVTGTRAEYGLLAKLIKDLHVDSELQLQLFVTGSHLSKTYGYTVQEILDDKIPITEELSILDSKSSPTAVATAVGRAIAGFADIFQRHKPDVVVILGDRFEILGAAQAAAFAGIPIAHIHGGEVTEGAFDEFIRHCLTKMATLHFVAAERYRQRVIQLGEQPERVFNVGAPGLDALNDLKLLNRSELDASLPFSIGDKFFLVTYHPETSGQTRPVASLQILLSTLKGYLPEFNLLVTYPNPDAFGTEMISILKQFQEQNSAKVILTPSLGRLRYLSALKHCRAVIGNSSSGIIEAPFFKVPTVNIGTRQNGRLKSSSVFDVECIPSAITKGITQALELTAEQRQSIPSLYGTGNANLQILTILRKTSHEKMAKTFFDLEFKNE